MLKEEIISNNMTTHPHNFNSYPPFFRPIQTIDHSEHSITKSELEPESESDSVSAPDLDSVPTIDFKLMNPENLSQVCRDWGMFRLVNHGIPVDLLGQLHEYANKLFSLDFESKQTLLTSPMLYFWGSPALTMFGNAQHTGSCSQNLNWLEGLNVPLRKVTQFEYQDLFLESFRSLLGEYGNHQTRLAKAIFTTMAEDLNFPPPKSASYLSPPTGILRIYRYLRCPTAEQRWGINSHTDSSVLSIIHQDQVGGLQVYKNDKWLDVTPIHDTLIVNVGDMMQAMSNDNYVSVKHRVKVNKEKERISMGYFVFPYENAMIESSKYKPFTYADFQAEKELDLKNVGIKIGLPRFRIT